MECTNCRRKVCDLAKNTSTQLSDRLFIFDKKKFIEKLLYQYGVKNFEVTILKGGYDRGSKLECNIKIKGEIHQISFIQPPIGKKFRLRAENTLFLDVIKNNRPPDVLKGNSDTQMQIVDLKNDFNLIYDDELIAKIVPVIINLGRNCAEIYLDIDDTLIHSDPNNKGVWHWNKSVYQMILRISEQSDVPIIVQTAAQLYGHFEKLQNPGFKIDKIYTREFLEEDGEKENRRYFKWPRNEKSKQASLTTIIFDDNPEVWKIDPGGKYVLIQPYGEGKMKVYLKNITKEEIESFSM